MKIRSNIKSGSLTTNQNEKIVKNDNNAVETKKTIDKKLRIGKETI